jgi:hypothetical protein
MQDLHDAIEAALEAAPSPELMFASGAACTPEDQARWQAAWDEAVGHSALAPPVGQLIQVHTPTLHPALDHPLVLGGITEIAARLEAARSTVVGWIKRAEKIGMPGPIAVLAAGPVFDLAAVEAWYRTWKAGDDTDGEAHA